MDPAGKTVIVTGASSGIGAATARALVQAGAHVVLAARDAARLDYLSRQLMGRTLVVPTDIANPTAAAALVARTVAVYGSVDIVVNNAGIGLAAPVAQMRAADLRMALDVNFLGPLYLTQAALPYMRRAGRGQLIFVSSVVGLRALPYAGGYAATKAALDRLTEALRTELRGSGIVVTLVRPGTTRTGFNTRRLGAGRERRRIHPRGVAPERVAATIVNAARQESRVAYVTWADRLTVLAALLLPGLADRLLASTFAWEEEETSGVRATNPER